VNVEGALLRGYFHDRTVSDRNRPPFVALISEEYVSMSKFHFIICTSCEMIRDRGRTLDDLSKAVELASRYARLLMAKARYKHIDFKVIEVRDERGWLLETVRFRHETPSSRYDREAIEAPMMRTKSLLPTKPSRARALVTGSGQTRGARGGSGSRDTSP
jgi:hypothetical protein